MARFGLEQGMRQEMQLLPRMLQSLEVLQLPVGELATYLQEAALENEALQFTETTGQEAALPEAELRHASADAPGADGPTAARGGREATERHDAWLEAQPGRAGGLAEVLGGELALLDLDDELAAWVRLVVESLDDNGYLSVGDDALQALAAEQGLAGDLGALGEAIAVVQGLEPRGVGGRDVVETLLLQLDPADADYALLCKLVEEFLGDIARNKLPAVARELGVEVDRLKELIERLRELDPAPGAALSGETSPALRPDVFVEPVEAAADELDGSAPTRREYRVRVVDSGLPEVTLDAGVAGLCKDRAQPAEVRRYLRE